MGRSPRGTSPRGAQGSTAATRASHGAGKRGGTPEISRPPPIPSRERTPREALGQAPPRRARRHDVWTPFGETEDAEAPPDDERMAGAQTAPVKTEDAKLPPARKRARAPPAPAPLARTTLARTPWFATWPSGTMRTTRRSLADSRWTRCPQTRRSCRLHVGTTFRPRGLLVGCRRMRAERTRCR